MIVQCELTREALFAPETYPQIRSYTATHEPGSVSDDTPGQSGVKINDGVKERKGGML